MGHQVVSHITFEYTEVIVIMIPFFMCVEDAQNNSLDFVGYVGEVSLSYFIDCYHQHCACFRSH